MNIIKIAILVLIAISTIGVTIFFAIRESEKKKKIRILILGILALICEVIVLFFAFPSYVFISWNKIIMEFAIFIIFLASALCSITPNRVGNTKDVLIAFGGLFLLFVGVLTLLQLSAAPIKGERIIVEEEKNVITKVNPTLDPIHNDPTIGYSIDAEGNTTYFYYYMKNHAMYEEKISENYDIYYLNSEEDSYILKETTTVSYRYSEKKDIKPITDIKNSYSIFINSNQVIMINETE